MANEYKQSTPERRLGKGTCVGQLPGRATRKNQKTSWGVSKRCEEGQGPGLHGNRGGGLDTHPHGNGGGVGSLW